MEKLWAELKRRNVVRVAIAYVVVSWVILQAIDVLGEILEVSNDFNKTILIILIIGFPITLFVSWAYEVTPEGVKKTEEVDQSKSITHSTGQRLNKMIIAFLGLAVAFLLVDKFLLTGTPVQEAAVTTEETQEEGTSIAVLPFVNLSDDPEQEYFSDGISEELLNVLVRVEGLSVASRTSAFAYKGQNPNLQEVAAKLNVEHILEGSVRRSGDTIRITAQLIDARTDRHLWSDTYDREFADIFAIQDEISSAIVEALKETLGMETLGTATVSVKTENLGAYEAFLQGRELFLARRNFLESAAFLERAVELDPNFVEAIETLAALYSVMPGWGFTDRPYHELAEEAANKAIAMDPSVSLSYAVLGSIKTPENQDRKGEHSLNEALQDYKRAIENNPKNATALAWRGQLYLDAGLFELGLDDFNQCLALDPAYGLCKRYRSMLLSFLGDHQEAIDLYLEGNREGYSPGANIAFYIYPMIESGNEMAVHQFLFAPSQQAEFPIMAWLDAYNNPDQNHDANLRVMYDWAAKEGFPPETAPDSMMFVFGKFEDLRGNHDYSWWWWWPRASAYRQSPQFKEFAADSGYLEFWKEVGFPSFCRPVGDEDFECD